jgi:hypothetical protein
MTTLLTGYNVDKPPVFAYINGRIYVTNGFDRVKVWNGIDSAMRDAGIAAPAAAPTAPTTASGNGTAGTHLIRFRYIDNTSPASTYRSNTSPNLSQVVTASGTDGKMTFTVGAGQKIVASTDPKVTSIQIEMTLASGTTFYVVTTISNAATTVDVNISDTLLQLNERGDLYDTNTVSTTDYGVGHEQPPLGAVIAQCRDYTFLGCDHPRTKTVSVTNASTSITGTGFSALWNSARLIRVGTDAVANEISSSTTTTMTLTNAYTGSTATAVSAQIYAKNPNRIYWCGYKSGAALPESWKAGARARDVLNGTGDTLRGMTEFNGDLLLVGRYTIQRLVFVDDPGVGELDIIPGAYGTWNQQCLIRIDGVLYGWGPNGAWLMAGGKPRDIGRNIQTTVSGLMDRSKMDQAHAHYDPVEKVVSWFYVLTGESIPRQSIALDINSGRWVRNPFRQGIDASIYLADANGSLFGILSDGTNGRTYYHYGATDGVPSTSTGAYTATTGSTTTVSQVTDTLPTGALTDLTGLIVYRPSTDEEKVIASNTSGAITHAAFATSVASGESLYVGAIPWSYTTPHFIGDGLHTKKRTHLWLTFKPSTVAGSVRIYVYLDQMNTATPTATTWTKVVSDQFPREVTLTNGASYFDVTFGASTNKGFVSIPMPADWSRCIQAKAVCLSPAGTLRFAGMEFALGNDRESKTAVNE